MKGFPYEKYFLTKNRCINILVQYTWRKKCLTYHMYKIFTKISTLSHHLLTFNVLQFLFDKMKSYDDIIDLYKSFMTRPKHERVSKMETKDHILKTAKSFNPYFKDDPTNPYKIENKDLDKSEYLWDKGDWQYHGGFFQIHNRYFRKQEYWPRIRIYLSMDYNFLHKYFFGTFMQKISDIEIDQSISISGKCPCAFKVDCGFAREDKWFLRSDNVVIYTIEKYLPFIMKALNDTFECIPKNKLELDKKLLKNNIFKPSMTCHSFVENKNLTFIERHVGLAPELSGCVESYNEAIAKFLINYKKENEVLNFEILHNFIIENLEIAKTVDFKDRHNIFNIHMLQPLLTNKRLVKVLKGEDPDKL